MRTCTSSSAIRRCSPGVTSRLPWVVPVIFCAGRFSGPPRSLAHMALSRICFRLFCLSFNAISTFCMLRPHFARRFNVAYLAIDCSLVLRPWLPTTGCAAPSSGCFWSSSSNAASAARSAGPGQLLHRGGGSGGVAQTLYAMGFDPTDLASLADGLPFFDYASASCSPVSNPISFFAAARADLEEGARAQSEAAPGGLPGWAWPAFIQQAFLPHASPPSDQYGFHWCRSCPSKRWAEILFNSSSGTMR